jgi:hypothetical protein
MSTHCWVAFGLIWTGCAFADLREQGPRDAAPSGLRAGVARADIAPPAGIPQLNWGSQTHVEAAGMDPMGMTATALVLSDGKQKFALVDIDAISTVGLEGAIARAAERTGIPASHIRIGQAHTHAGPAFHRAKGPVDVNAARYEGMMASYRAMVADKIVAAIAEADSRLRPVHAFATRGTGSINVNRRYRASGNAPPAVGRNPQGFVDRELIVMRIDDAGGAPYAVLVNFQCHGTVLGYENKYISPDWIGAMRKTVEKALPGTLCLYLQGAAGNQGPIEGFTGDLEVAHRLGGILGLEAAALALRTETVRREPRFEGFVESTAYQAKQPRRVLGPRDATLEFVDRVIELPRREYTAAEIEAKRSQLAGAREKLAAAKASGDRWRIAQAEARERRIADLLAAWQRPADRTPVKLGVQIFRVGEVAMVGVAGEPFAEIGAAIKRASPFPVTMFAGYTSLQGGGYMPIRSEYAYGGYEVEMTPYGLGAAEKLIAEASAMFRSVR